MAYNKSKQHQDNDNYEQIKQEIDQLLLDNIVNMDNCEDIIEFTHPIEIRIEGRPLSFQNKTKQNKVKYEIFKEEILKNIDKFGYFITNRVKIEIELHIKEITLHEDNSLLDTDNIPKILIDILHQSFPRSVLIEDTQVDAISSKRIPILSKARISENEHFLIRILPSNEDVIFAIKKDKILFIPIDKGNIKSNSKLYYPVPSSSQEIIAKTISLFECLNISQNKLSEIELKYIRFWLYLVSLAVESRSCNLMRYISCNVKCSINVDEYMLSMGMLSGTGFPSRILNKGFKVIPLVC